MNLKRISPVCKSAATLLLLAATAWLAGCASMPEPLRGGPENSPDPALVRAEPDRYRGVAVRWGGDIINVDNGPEQSEIEVVSRPLADDARPMMTDKTSGRFLVRINGFVDPVDYTTGREITVVGVLEGVEQRKIGEHTYSYPVVRATSHYLWPIPLPPVPDYYYYSPFYDPFYDPWYPFGPYYYPYPYMYPYSYPYAYPHSRPGYPYQRQPQLQRIPPQPQIQRQPPIQQLPQIPRQPPIQRPSIPRP